MDISSVFFEYHRENSERRSLSKFDPHSLSLFLIFPARPRGKLCDPSFTCRNSPKKTHFNMARSRLSFPRPPFHEMSFGKIALPYSSAKKLAQHLLTSISDSIKEPQICKFDITVYFFIRSVFFYKCRRGDQVQLRMKHLTVFKSNDEISGLSSNPAVFELELVPYETKFGV